MMGVKMPGKMGFPWSGTTYMWLGSASSAAITWFSSDIGWCIPPKAVSLPPSKGTIFGPAGQTDFLSRSCSAGPGIEIHDCRRIPEACRNFYEAVGIQQMKKISRAVAFQKRFAIATDRESYPIFTARNCVIELLGLVPGFYLNFRGCSCLSEKKRNNEAAKGYD